MLHQRAAEDVHQADVDLLPLPAQPVQSSDRALPAYEQQQPDVQDSLALETQYDLCAYKSTLINLEVLPYPI